MDSIAEQIVGEMERRGMSAAELARRAGVSYNVVRELKRRPKQTPRAEHLAKLCKALGMEHPFAPAGMAEAPSVMQPAAPRAEHGTMQIGFATGASRCRLTCRPKNSTP